MASPRPSYLLTEISPELRKALSSAAAEQDRSLNDLVRVALAEAFEVNLPATKRGRRYVSWMDGGRSSRMVIRCEPELFDAVKRESSASDRTMRDVILDVLTERFMVTLGS